MSFLGTGQTKRVFGILPAKTGKTRPAPLSSKRPPPDAPDLEIWAFPFPAPEMTHFSEHGTMGLENLSRVHTLLGGEISDFTGQWAPEMAKMHCTR